jgi:hypothetical protein
LVSDGKLMKYWRIILTLVVLMSPASAFAISTDDRKAVLYDTVFYDTKDYSGPTVGCANVNLTGSDNMQKIFNYFVAKGLTPAQSAGIDGNFGAESGWNPTDTNSIGAYGIAQWLGGRKAGLQQFASQQGKPVSDLGLQLDYVWHELQGGESGALKALQQTSNATDAALSWEKNYERSGGAILSLRVGYANKILALYGSGAAPGNPPGDSECK